jgi:Na+/H+ antiporter NhaD/arsenite permease-like protein
MSEVDRIVFNILIGGIFVLVAVQLLFPSNGVLPLDRRLISLFGAVLCASVNSLFPDISQVSTGSFVDFTVLLVLISIMAINFMLLRQPWLRAAVQHMEVIIRKDIDRGFFLVSFISFCASPLILNDGLCLMLVNPVLDSFVPSAPDALNGQDQGNNSRVDNDIAKIDAFYYMLTIACSANIGSVMTFSGNPQNVIVAQFLSQYMNCATFFALMLLPAVVCWLISTYLLNHFRKQARKELVEKRSNLAATMNVLHEIPAGESSHDEHEHEHEHEYDPEIELGGYSNNHIELLAALDEEILHDKHDSYDPMAFSTIVFSLFALLITLEFAGIFPLAGLFSVLSVVMICMTVIANYYYHAFLFMQDRSTFDGYSTVSTVTIGPYGHEKSIQFRGDRIPPILFIRKISASLENLFHQLDYNLLIIFIGLFIISGSFLQTGIPKKVWETFASNQPFQSFSSVFVLSIYIIVASQLVGNVPVVYMAKEEIQNLSQHAQVFGWLVLSWVATVAGNFTLVGSAANIIVVEKAAR